MSRYFAKNRTEKIYKLLTYTACALAIIFIFLQNIAVQRWPFPRIRAESYVAPVGCIVKKYKNFDEISNSCCDERYRLSYFYTSVNHLNNGGGRGYFYRVGNDVVKIGCPIFSGPCNVSDVTFGVYYQ